ncbi:SprT family zinc-dependent metalloprotease [Fulvimarina sp. MAC3]|uniref:M48 family metallopeptidase n=1 Tax=Fulvimarina sp. MAC3 TaxID=3148887 RepID=UPI0031FC4201
MALKLRSLYRRPEASTPLPDFVEAGGRQVPLTVRENARAKRLILRIAPDGGAVVTVPPKTRRKTLSDFITRHQGWIAERAGGAAAPVLVTDGGSIPLRGETVKLVYRGGRRVSRFDTQSGELTVGGMPEHFGRRVKDFLRKEAKADLMAAVSTHAASVGLSPKMVTLKDTVSRWGSCTSDRRLSFSWRIVMAPPHVLDYLAAHEVAHFKEMNHSAAFWAVCRELCPRMDEGRDWLKTNGASLHRIRFD